MIQSSFVTVSLFQLCHIYKCNICKLQPVSLQEKAFVKQSIHRIWDHCFLSPGFSYLSTPPSYSWYFSHSPCIKSFQRFQAHFQSKVYLHLVCLYNMQITIKPRFSAIKLSWKLVELLGSIQLIQSQESSADWIASLLAQGVTTLYPLKTTDSSDPQRQLVNLLCTQHWTTMRTHLTLKNCNLAQEGRCSPQLAVSTKWKVNHGMKNECTQWEYCCLQY